MKKLTIMLMATLTMFALVTTASAADTWNGDADMTWYSQDGSSFEISTAEELAGLATLVNEGNDFSEKTITLTDDLDLNSREWTPIGTAKKTKAVTDETVFAGTFIATDCTISNLTITSGGADDGLGLFGGVTGTVQNVTLTNVSIDVTDAETIGAVVGFLCEGGSVTGCTVGAAEDDTSIISATEAGGVVGRIMAEGSIINCTNYATITGSANAGGIANKAYYGATGTGMTISGCVNYGEITASTYHAGGIVAFSAATITDCTNHGVILTNGKTAGGIVGEQTTHGNVTGCVNTAKVTGNLNAGGIVGWVRYQNSSSYPNPVVIEISGNENTADVSTLAGGDSDLGTGGIVGSIYNAATVTGNTCEGITIIGKTFASGIVGNLQESSGNYFYDDDQSDYTITVTGNTITDVKVYGVCKAEVAYDNTVGGFTVENNTVSNVTLANLVTTQAELTTAVNDAIAGDLIVLGANITLTATITPKVNITIDGQSVYAIDGDGLADNGITLSGDVDLTLQNLTMKNFTASSKGAIFGNSTGTIFEGTLTVTNCSFSNFNKYAICINWGNLVLDSSVLDAESTISSRTPNIVQLSRSATATITNCTFKNSDSTAANWDASGLMFCAGGMPDTITGNTFTNCATAIYFDDYWDTLYDTDYWDYDTSSSSYASDALFTQLLEDNDFSGSQDSNIRTTVIAEGTAYISSDGVSTFWHSSFPDDVLCYFKPDHTDATPDYFTTLEDAIRANEFTNYVIATGKTVYLSTSSELLSGITLTVMEGAILVIKEDITLTNNGAIVNDGTIRYEGELLGDGTYRGNAIVTEIYEAKIDDTYYYTLSEAISAATSEQTVEVLSDATLTATTITKSITLDLGGNTVTCTSTSNGGIVINSSSVDVTIKNGTLQCDTIGKTIWSYQVNALVLENLTVTNGYTNGVGVYTNNTVTNSITIQGSCDFSKLTIFTVAVSVATDATLTIGEDGLYMEGTLTNNGTIICNGTLTNNGGTLTNNGAIAYPAIQEDEVSGGVAYIAKDDGYYYYYATLAKAIEKANDGDVITLLNNVTIENGSNIAIGEKSLTFVGATGNETIITNSGSAHVGFNLTNGYSIAFDNLTFDISGTMIYLPENDNNYGISFTNCDVTLNDDAYLFSGDQATADITFTNNTVDGAVKKVFIARVGSDNTLLVTGNTFTFEGANIGTETTSAVGTIVVRGEGAKVIITGNTITNFYRGFSIDSSTVTGSWTITGNKFINTQYALNYDSNIGYNNISMAYNFNSATADGEGTVVGLLDEETANVGTSVVTLYPYYSNSAMTTLVYADETTKTPTEAATDALDTALSGSATTEDITAAVDVVVAVDKETLAADDTLLEMVNDLDTALMDTVNDDNTTGSLYADVSIDTNSVVITGADTVDTVADADLKVNDSAATEVIGLAVAVVGNDEIAVDTTVTVTLEIAQTAATVSADDGTLAATISYEISPTKTVTVDATSNVISSGTVSNEEISAPVTFKLHLPSIFDDTNRATVTHDGADLGTYVVYHDGSDNYIWITTTHFSEFTVSLAANVSTSSGTASYTSTVASTSNGDVSISSSKSAMNSTVTITATPDDGYVVDTVSVTYASGKEVSVTDNGDGTYSYRQPGAAVTVTVTFVESDGTTEADDDTTFDDVDEDAYYYDAVMWAVDLNITTGTDDNSFSPNATCTRAQAVTFLWRAMGSPLVDYENPFTDLDEDAYYYDAVLWAVSKGITQGMTDTTFAPGADCTRGQIVTFLWRLAGEVEVDGESLSDVDADSYFYAPVLWAVSEGITTGYEDGTFGADDLCTRGQIVTFLYRDLAD